MKRISDDYEMSSSSSVPERDVLLGCTGSIAAVKLPALTLALHDAGLTVTVVLTKAGACGRLWGLGVECDERD